MAKKCEYSAKYKPLVLAKRSQLISEDAFQNWLRDTFTNPEVAAAISSTGEPFLSDLNVEKKKLQDFEEDVDSIRSYFVTDATGYNKCVKSFINNVIESSIYNKDTNTWIDANQKVGDGTFDELNANLFNYKLKLINTINKNKSNLNIDINDPEADIKLTKAINDALYYIDQTDELSVDSEQYEAYVILKNFNKLIEEKTKFIKIRKEYENTTSHGVNMYVYSGPNVKLRRSFTTNEHISAVSQYSDLAVSLLNYFPEYNGSSEIPNTVIGRDGFVSIMNKFKTALIYSTEMATYRTQYFDGKLDITAALKHYLNVVERASQRGNINQAQITTLVSKLQGIIHYIFDSKVAQDVKEMFIGMFEKTVPLSYMTYAWKNGEFGGINLTDSYVNTQQLNLQDIVNGRVLYFRKNKTQFKRLIEKWGIKIDWANNTITIVPQNIPNIDILISGLKGEVKEGYEAFDPKDVRKNISEENVANLISDVLGIYLPTTDYSEASKYVNKNGNLWNDFFPLITMTLLGGNPETPVGQYGFVPLKTNDTLNFKKLHLYANFEAPARTMSVLYGSEVRNVVNDLNNHHLPTNGLTAMIFNSPRLAAEMGVPAREGYRDPFKYSPLALRKTPTGVYNPPKFLPPIIRQGVRIGSKVKDVSSMDLSELLEIAIMYDFYDQLRKGEDIIYLQNTNVADKERQFIVPYLISDDIWIEGKRYNMKTLLKEITAGNKQVKYDGKTAQQYVEELWWKLRKERYEAIAHNIIQDYSIVYNKTFSTLEQLDKFLIEKNVSVDQIRKDFRNKKINFKEEIHATNLNGKARANETLMHYLDTFANLKNAQKRLNRSRAYFAYDLFKTRTKLNKYTNNIVSKIWPSWQKDATLSTWLEKVGNQETGNLILFKVYNEKGDLVPVSASNPDAMLNPKYKVVLNPILESYLLSDIIYSNEYNFLHVGDVFCHPTKSKKGDTTINEFGTSEYYDTCEASRLVAQNKRAVIYGGAIHSFQHDLAGNRGVAKKINVAMMADIPAKVWNMIGGLKNKSLDDVLDSMDGSGLQSIYEAILEQESLKDAAAGVDEKTILGWNDKEYGKQILLKWAVYALTNERRRLSRNSKLSGEKLFQKMHNKKFDLVLNMAHLWKKHVSNDIYFRDIDSGKHYKILGVQDVTFSDGTKGEARTIVECDQYGQTIENAKVMYLTNRNQVVNNIINKAQVTYNTLYDLDQFFGGAYEESLQDGKLIYTSNGNHIVADIICENNLKDYFIAYAVNKSAVKVGVENLNDESKWYDDEDLDTTIMSTEYGGLQMNAEHELEDSEVREMTQMISALVEKGFSYDVVKQIYSDIGGVVIEALKPFKEAIKNNVSDPSKLKVIFGKALIEAYAKGDRDTVGLAQAFLAKAERTLKENNIEFTFPFSGATINPSFIATVASLFNKRGIRRKYAGVAAVLTPSYNMIQVYGEGKTLEKYIDEINTWKQTETGAPYANVSAVDLMTKIKVKTNEGIEILNPFIRLDVYKEFTFEDTIVVRDEFKDPNTNEITYTYTPVVIDGFETYDKWKHSNKTIYIWKSRPRNLKGANTTWKMNGRSYSIYDSSAVRAANYAILDNWTPEQTSLIFDVLQHAAKVYRDEIVWRKDNPEQSDIDSLALAINLKDRNSLVNIIDLKKTLYNLVQRQLRDLSNDNIFNDVKLTRGLIYHVNNVQVEAAEIIMGKLFAKQFGLTAGDDIQTILQQGSDFFYKRISGNYREPEDVPTNRYDAIVYTKNGEKLLVKLDPKLEYNFDKSANPNITKVDGVAYLNQEELTSSENKEFYQIKGDAENVYNVVVLGSVDAFYDLVNSKQIVQYKINYKNDLKTAIDLALEVSDDEEHVVKIDEDTEWVGTLLDLQTSIVDGSLSEENALYLYEQIELQNLDARIRKQANNMAESFKLSLNMVGTRIPAQAMQSFQPMKIVAFTDSETNDVYVNRHNTYIEGSDYDIDKSYILSYEVNDDGLVETGSRLARRIGIENALRLEIAKGRTFEEGYGEGSFAVSNILLTNAINGNVEALNLILKSGATTLAFEGVKLTPEQEGNPDYITSPEYQKRVDRYERRKQRLIKMLNIHERSYVSEAALKNRVVQGIREVALDPKNQLNFTNPVSMASQQSAAEKSDLSKDESTINMDIPSSKYMMQQQNMVGKQCIGITAVAIKTFFAKSAYYDEALSQIPALLDAGQDSNILAWLNSLVITNPVTGNITLLANVNVTDVLERIKRKKLTVLADRTSPLSVFNEGAEFNLERCLKYLRRQSNRVDAAMELSGLLSSATDNAKELLLAKINATSRFIDLYTVAIQSGATFEEISNIMMTPIFNALSRVATNNIFKTYEGSYRLEKVINFYLDAELGTYGRDAILPGVKWNHLKRFLCSVRNADFQNTSDKEVTSWLQDTTWLQSIRSSAYSLIGRAREVLLTDDGYDIEVDGQEDIPTKKDRLCIANFIEECINRNLTKERLRKKYGDIAYNIQIENVKTVQTKLIPAAEEQGILGRMLGINQGLKTSGYTLYSNIWYIEDFISRKLQQPERFELMRFLSDEKYKRDMINAYEQKKELCNILDVISKVPHFAEMFNLMYDNDYVLSNLSAKYKLTQQLANRISPKYALKENEYKQVGYYINDLFLVSYLTSSGRTITVPKDCWYYPDGNDEGKYASDSVPRKLDNLYGLASFKSWMENYVIPTLQQTDYGKTNAFLRNLTRSVNTNRVTNEEQSYYKLPLDMSSIDQSQETKDQYEAILNGFNSIANTTFEGWKIADLFFVYNAIVNKEGFGRTSMTRIFEDLVNEKTSSTMVSDYYEFISKIDSDPKLREEFAKSLNNEDVKSYIKAKVPGTYLGTNAVWSANYDFTFRMPSLLGLWKVNRPKIDTYEDNHIHSYNLTNTAIVEELAQNLFSKYGSDSFEVISNYEVERRIADKRLPDSVKNEPAFIYQGVVYINSSYAQVGDLLHEYAHLMLAELKYNKDEKYRNLYYKLMSHIKTSDNYNIMAEKYKNMGLTGTDLDEEVFCKHLQKYFNGQIELHTSMFDNILESSESTLLEALGNILKTDLDGGDLLSIINSNPNVIIRKFGSGLFNFQPDVDLAKQSIRWRSRTQQLRTAFTTGENPPVTFECN